MNRNSVPLSARRPARPAVPAIARIAVVILVLFVFLLGVKGLGDGFGLLGRDIIDRFFTVTSNPFIGLIVGLLATTLVQSSSVTTAMIVGLVAAPASPLPLANAVPMIMGANIGTTVTATLVSLGHMGRREEFERAFPVAICHDIFNYLAVLVLLPIELATGYLRRSAVALATLVEGGGGVTYESPIKAALSAAFTPMTILSQWLFRTQTARAVFLIVVSGVLIVVTLYLLVTLMRAAVHTRVEGIVTNVFGANPLLAMVAGVVVTIMVQSSSITTSLLVPLAGAGLLKLEQAFPVTLGANLGTTVTAFLAALAVSGPNAAAGLEIALVHLLFNLSGIVLIYPVPAVRARPLSLARLLTRAAVRSPKVTALWIGALFYGIPALVLLVDRWLT